MEVVVGGQAFEVNAEISPAGNETEELFRYYRPLEWADDAEYPLRYSTYAYELGINAVIYAMSY